MRLIDADILTEKLERVCRQNSPRSAMMHSYVFPVIEELMTVDTVPVVRCNDCKYFSKVCSCDKTVTFVDEDFYCAD